MVRGNRKQNDPFARCGMSGITTAKLIKELRTAFGQRQDQFAARIWSNAFDCKLLGERARLFVPTGNAQIKFYKRERIENQLNVV